MASETRNQAQKPAHKDIRPKWQNQPFRSDATYAPVSNRV
ncbi:Alpha-galactosidase [Lacticaseibacillus paracasei subsp. paracasei]|uniref:Alpha-galactosidase n=1 Tax=Lacticaseibacillus paracasei subsp. paracasei TaxID=47714 RepID=A0AAP9HJX3_LACPA|nr:alpha-galactosidase [Lacticaseibacillus paracasei]QGV19698.1 Alpha-galactosidase [Lacticaseibacillus paracasei subsp. paracasei]